MRINITLTQFALPTKLEGKKRNESPHLGKALLVEEEASRKEKESSLVRELLGFKVEYVDIVKMPGEFGRGENILMPCGANFLYALIFVSLNLDKIAKLPPHMSTSWLLSTPYSKLNHHFYRRLRRKHRLIYSRDLLFSGTGEQMVTTNSASSSRGAFTTLKERVIFEKEIKKSKFIAIAGHIPDEGLKPGDFLSCRSLGGQNYVVPVAGGRYHVISVAGGRWQVSHGISLRFAKTGPVTTFIICRSFGRQSYVIPVVGGRWQVRDPRATHNCWAYKVGEQYRTNDDGEPSGTAGKPIHSAIASSGLDRIMVVVIRHFGGIKLGTGGLVRAYGGVAAECLRNAPTCIIKSKVPMGLEVPFELLGALYHQLQSFQAEDIKQDYDTGKDGVTMVTFKVDFDHAQGLEEAIKANCSRDIVFYKH
ncbi:IMPACT family member in pol 5'region [Capsicum annuum]|nr:IMPACT family member in pol 5'region [Capsicum annuum]